MKRLAVRRRQVQANARRVVRVRIGRRTARRARRVLRRRGHVRVAVMVRATDGAGNVARRTRRGRITRRR